MNDFRFFVCRWLGQLKREMEFQHDDNTSLERMGGKYTAASHRRFACLYLFTRFREIHYFIRALPAVLLTGGIRILEVDRWIRVVFNSS